jgi:hypothetical protein
MDLKRLAANRGGSENTEPLLGLPGVQIDGLVVAVILLSSCAERSDDSASLERGSSSQGSSSPQDSSKSKAGSKKHRPSRRSSASSRSEKDPEYKLASIDAGYELDLDDPSIQSYGRLLNRLDRKCPDADRTFVGDMAVKSTQILADEGVTASILEMLEGADIALSGGTQDLRIDCPEIFASIAVMMIGN